MNPQLKKMLIGAVILILLVGAYLVSAKVSKNKDKADENNNTNQEQEQEAKALLDKSSEDIVNAVIKRENDTIELVKVGEGDNAKWAIKGYEDIAFNEDNINMLANNLAKVEYDSKICDVNADTTSETLKEYGLDAPSVKAEINFKDNTNAVINIGKATTDSEFNYAMVDGGDGIYLVSSLVASRYNYTLNDLVSKEVTSINPVQILYVDVKQRDREEIEVEYKEEGEGNVANLASYGMQALTMHKPMSGAAVYPTNLQSTILEKATSFALSDVVEVKPSDLSKYGLDNPYLQISLKDANGSFSYKIGNAVDDNSYYCMVDDRNVVYTVNKELITPYENANIIDFIERFVALVYKKDVKEVEISNGSEDYKLVLKDNPEDKNKDKDKDNDDSQEEDDNRIGVLNGKEIDEDSFSGFYQSIIGITFDSIDNKEPIGDKPAVTMKYTMLDGSVREVKYYDYKPNNNFYIVEIDNDTSRLVNKQSIKAVFEYAQKLLKDK